MARKFKTTAFARFFLVMIVLAPLTYIGASYINGEDGIQKAKQLIGLEQASDNQEQKSTKKVNKKKATNEVERLREENARLKKMIEQKDKEIAELEAQLRKQ